MEKRKFWYLIGTGVLVVFLFILLSNIMQVGTSLRDIHPYVEYGFYGLSAILVYVLIINPLRVIVFAPTFSVSDIMNDEAKRFRVYKDAANILMKNEYLTEDDKVRLTDAMKDKSILKNELTNIFQTTIKDKINEIIIRNSKTVMISTALSQNGNLDMLSVIAINLKMIKEITVITGFRPTYPKLLKLSINVMATSIIAEGLDDLDMTELLPNKISETLTDLPFVKTLSNSFMSGTANGLLTCRVGIVTQKYLFTDNELLDPKAIRRMAYKESIKMMPQIVSGGLAALPKGLFSVFAKPFKKKDKGDIDEEVR